MGGAIIFVCAFVACTICSMFWLIFASHYFLVTVIDSSAGHDEVEYPRESVIDWWWKPLFCLWILGFWVVVLSIVLAPLLAVSPKSYGICLALLILFFYPLGVLSALFTSNWLFFLHPIIIVRMLKHYSAFAYVHLVTLLVVSACVGLLLGTFTLSFWLALPAAFVVPGAILFYARQWGRFAWLSLNFAPRVKKGPRAEYAQAADKKAWPGNTEEDVPELAVQEVDEAADGMREGLPPAFPHGIKTGMPGGPEAVVAAAPPQAAEEEEDEFAPNKKPYKLVDDPTRPSFQEAAPEPVSVAASPPPPLPPVVVEEEDEWATDKKPYVVIDEPAAPAQGAAAPSEADKPIAVSKYYDERHRKEKAAKAKAKEIAGQHYLPPPSKKTPTFATALFLGVWEFMLYGKTLQVWANLVVFTIVELALLSMVVQFWRRLD
jgi:hypothetical protein